MKSFLLIDYKNTIYITTIGFNCFERHQFVYFISEMTKPWQVDWEVTREVHHLFQQSRYFNCSNFSRFISSICILGFSPKFLHWSISFSQMTNIFRSGASPFFNVQAVHRRPLPAYCSQPRGLAAGQSASQTRPSIHGQHMRIFHNALFQRPPLIPTKWVLEIPIFMLELALGPPIFVSPA